MTAVAVLFGGPSPEHDVSVLTGLQAARQLASGPDPVRALYWSKAGEFSEVDPALEAEAFVTGAPRGATPLRLVAGGGFSAEGGRFGRPRSADLDVVVVCCHGGPGEDGTLQAALDLAQLAYTGPGVAGAALGMDKLAFAGVLGAAGLPVLPRVLLGPAGPDPDFSGPYIVKPRFGGSSIGIEVVADVGAARALAASSVHLRAGAVLEPYRPDLVDLQVGVRTFPELAVSTVERPLRSSGGGVEGGILGYADKYVGGEGMASAPRDLPANIPPETTARIGELARAVAALCSVRGVARVDFLGRTDGGELVVNEINTIPGSLARYLWDVPFGTLLADLMAEARARPTHAYSAAGADGTVLRGAAAIAAKLA